MQILNYAMQYNITFLSVVSEHNHCLFVSFMGNKEGTHCNEYSSEYICLILLTIFWTGSTKKKSHKDNKTVEETVDQ